MLKNFNRNLSNFNKHSLRYIRAIVLVLRKMDNDTIMKKIGWTDTRSLNRYKIIPRELILKLGDLDIVIDHLIKNDICI